MKTVQLHEAKTKLEEIVTALPDTGEIIITRDDEPVARLSPLTPKPSLRDLRPISVGALLRPIFAPDDDLLEDMLAR